MKLFKKLFNKKSSSEPVVSDTPIIDDVPIMDDIQDDPPREIIWDKADYEHIATLDSTKSKYKYLKLYILETPTSCSIHFRDDSRRNIDLTKIYNGITIEKAKKIANTLAESVADAKIIGWRSSVTYKGGKDSFDKLRIFIHRDDTNKYVMSVTFTGNRYDKYVREFNSIEEAITNIEHCMLKGLL